MKLSTFESRTDESWWKLETSKDQTTQWKSNSTPQYTHARLFSLSCYCRETHWEQEKDRATRDDHCEQRAVPLLWPQPQLQPLSSSLSRQTSESLVCVRRERCPGPVAASLVTDGAAVLLIDIPPGCGGGLGPWLLTVICCRSLLPPLGHKESQCQTEEAEWSSQAAGQTVRAHIPSFKWTAEPGEASGQVRQTQAYWEAAREGGGVEILFLFPRAFPTSRSFGFPCWENADIKISN